MRTTHDVRIGVERMAHLGHRAHPGESTPQRGPEQQCAPRVDVAMRPTGGRSWVQGSCRGHGNYHAERGRGRPAKSTPLHIARRPPLRRPSDWTKAFVDEYGYDLTDGPASRWRWVRDLVQLAGLHLVAHERSQRHRKVCVNGYIPTSDTTIVAGAPAATRTQPYMGDRKARARQNQRSSLGDRMRPRSVRLSLPLGVRG
jgi:hypothetical protein